MQAVHDRIILRAIPRQTETAGGITIPVMGRGDTFEVVAVGKGKLLDNGQYAEPSVKPGDRVIINEHTGSELHNEDGVFWVVRDEEILGIIE